MDCWVHVGAPAAAACAGPDEREPNDTVSMANHVPDATCVPQTIKGSMATDVDVFRTFGPRCSGAKPSATLQSSDPTMRLCMFAACKFGKTGITGCSAGAVATHLPEGVLGCCLAGAGTVALDVNCDSDGQFVDLALTGKQRLTSYMVVDRASGVGCTDYQLTYHY